MDIDKYTFLKLENFENMVGVYFKDNFLVYNYNNGKILIVDKKNASRKDIEEVVDLISVDQNSKVFYEDTQDIINFNKQFPQSPNYEQLYLVVTEECNIACKYCRQLNYDRTKRMTKKEIKNVVDECKRKGINLKSVVFYGGEPLLNKEYIIYAIDYINELYEGKQIEYSMITNGVLCDVQTAGELKNRNVSVILSIDGPMEFNDKARIDKGGKSIYNKAIEGYFNLKDTGCVIGINSVLGPHNQDSIEQLVEWILEIDPNTVGFALPHGDKTNYAMQVQFSKLYKDIISAHHKLKEYGISIIQVERKLKDIVLNNLNSYECRAARNRIVAVPNSRYGVCEGAVGNSEYFYSNMEDIIKTSCEFQKTSPLVVRDCLSCYARRICGGGCPYDKIMRYGRVDVKDEYRCGFIKEVVRYSLKVILDSATGLIDNYSNFDGVSYRIIDGKMSDSLYNQLDYSKSNFVPLKYNCDARYDK